MKIYYIVPMPIIENCAPNNNNYLSIYRIYIAPLQCGRPWMVYSL